MISFIGADGTIVGCRQQIGDLQLYFATSVVWIASGVTLVGGHSFAECDSQGTCAVVGGKQCLIAVWNSNRSSLVPLDATGLQLSGT